MDEIVVEAQGLVKRYGATTALDGVDFDLRSGRIVGLLGPNGAGKSTCLHLISGLQTPDAGSVTIGGIPAAEPAAKQLFGFAPDDLPLPAALTGREYLRLHDRLRRREDLERGLVLLEAFDIADAADRQIVEYSHGMKRKIQLASAIMHAPELLILDEPFRGLDPDSVAVLSHVIAEFVADGRTVLIATHDLARAQTTCDEVLIIDRGVIAGSGEPGRLVAQHGSGIDLEAAFLALTGREHDAARRKRLVSDSLKGTAS